MATRSNTSSVDMGKGLKLSHLATQQTNETDSNNTIYKSVSNKQRKPLSADAKAKAKKRAKLAKASRKKNK